ncbi:PspA/IM30 family protein [Trichocoleus sp. DQ-A3]|uniref:PspA/IM30 family protein n=1 Tax=Cyanophyceae TaxID=3028117 RepID=UPI001681D77F|nr:PspA/IM30 family protein [Coleofasciculus sp. FACHB-125]MBD2083860.1 PspA/IM30 family protein [Coleofasciculus sp. FACHB-542]
MGLFERISRIVRAEINHINRENYTGNFGDGTAFAAGGATSGAAIGKIGIVAKGGGFSVGAVPLGAAGALTGLALYEAIRAIAERNTRSLGAAAAGAAAGAGISGAIGGVGVAAGGTAFAVGMAPMAAAGAVAGLGIASLARLIQQGIDPEKLLELAIEDMHEDLVKLRKAVVPVIVAQKRLLQQYNQAQTEVNNWHQRAQLALQKEDENLAREAILRKKIHAETASTLKAQIDQGTAQVDTLKRNLAVFESKVSEAKAYKPILKARIQAAKAQEQLQNTVGRLNTSRSMAAFERMEEKVLELEARSTAAAELTGNNLDQQFAMLESGNDVDDELAAMKAQLTGSSTTQAQLPAANPTTTSSKSNLAVDNELEDLKKQLDNL